MPNKYSYIKEEANELISSENLFKITICLLIFVIPLCFLIILSPQTTQAYISPIGTKTAESEISKRIASIPSQTDKPIPTTTPQETWFEPSPTTMPTDIPSPSPTPLTPKKQTYSIVIFGDSMVDTMGEALEYLQGSLRNKYPQIEFKLYNYGIGSQNVSEGIDRFCQTFNYKNRYYPSLCTLKPDILILGSFAYNPFSPYDRNEHWLALSKLIEEARKVTSNVYLLAEIAPLRNNFGKGVNGVNWDTNTASQHADHIIQMLENTLGLSQTLNVPLIDAFSITQINSAKEGDKKYVNGSDGIHPSVLGHEFMASLIAQTIKLDN